MSRGQGKNIFQIWKDVGEHVPFAVRRENWSGEFYTVVESVKIGRWPYGWATGYPTKNGVPNDHYEYDEGWKSARVIPNAGSYQWALVPDADLLGAPPPPTVPLSTKAVLLTLGSSLRFGKYKGRPVTELISSDPAYLYWVMLSVSAVAFDPSVLEALESVGKAIPDDAREAARARYEAFIARRD